MNISKYIPILEWLPDYEKKYFRKDLIAGITVAVMLVPQGMAYALLAGLPPIYGLYAGIVPLLLYAFFGTSRQLSVGPVALVSLLILSGVGAFAEPNSDLFITLAITTALIAGVIQIFLGLFKLGFLINFLSHPVISGFTSAAALIIGFSQLKNLLRIELPRSNQIHSIIGNAIANIEDTHLLTLAIGIGGVILMLILKKIKKSLPTALIAVIVFTVLVWALGLDAKGIDTVGVVPRGLPSFMVPDLTMEQFVDLLPLALTICLISFIESLAIAKTIEAKHKSYRVVPNQELLALGLTKIGGAFFQSFPTTGSFTRSAINNDAGAKTGISSIISAGIIALTLLFLTPLFFYLPKAILASIIIVAVIGLIDFKEAVYLWKNDKRDFASLITTFLITITIGIQAGVFAGIVLSIALIIYQNSRPHVAILGQIPDTAKYRNISRFPQAIQEEGVLILRFDAQLYFGNAEYFRDTIEELVEIKKGNLKLIILDASSIHDVDSSGLHIFKDVLDYLKERNVKLYLSGVIGPVRDFFHKTGLIEMIGEKNQFMRIHDAMAFYISNQNGKKIDWTPDAIQTNIETDLDES